MGIWIYLWDDRDHLPCISGYAPEMDSELRVTIVATGIGQIAQLSAPDATTAPVRLVQRSVSSVEEDRKRFERSAAGNRRQKAAGENFTDRSEEDLEYLDIPAFLRRQAD